MLEFFKLVGQTFRKMLGLVLPIFKNASDFRNWPTIVRVAIGLALLATLCFAAYLLQHKILKLNQLLQHLTNDFLRDYYLVILVLLLVAFSWLAYLFWSLLAQEPEAAEFPDIGEAWSEAVARLQADGMRLDDAPLFLALGRPAAGLDAFFLAAGVKEIIRTPSGGDPPLRLYAWRDAIYVTAPDCSAWSTLSVQFVDGGSSSVMHQANAAVDPKKTISVSSFDDMDEQSKAEMEALVSESGRRDLRPEEQERLRFLVEQSRSSNIVALKKISLPEEMIQRGVRRLKYLCKLIANERRPWCPVNGLIVLVPWEATESEESARIASNVMQRDLNAAREALQLRYPVYAVVCDLETARGFEEFRSSFPPDMLKQRIGQRLPLVPDIDPDKAPALISQSALWIGLSILPSWILKFLRLDPGQRSGPPAHQHNRSLYMLMRGVLDRGPRLAQVLSRGIPPLGGNDSIAHVPYFGGCYLAATGKEGRGQAFVPGIFDRLLKTVDNVAWSPEAQARDTRLRNLTLIGYIFIVMLLAITAYAAYVVFQGKS